MPVLDSTKTAILDAAQELAQTCGYNAFSFADLAERVGIRTASIHYHFPSKGALGRELVIRYREMLAEAVRDIEARTKDPVDRLRRFVAVLRGAIRRGTRMCLCGMFGAEFPTLPGPMQDEVRALFGACESWLAGVLRAGRTAGAMAFVGDPERVAEALFSSLQGAMLAACPFSDESRFTTAADFLILQILVPERPRAAAGAGRAKA